VVKIGADDDFDLRVEPKVMMITFRLWSHTILFPEECHGKWQLIAEKRNMPALVLTSFCPKKVPNSLFRHRFCIKKEGVMASPSLFWRLYLRWFFQWSLDIKKDRWRWKSQETHRQGAETDRKRFWVLAYWSAQVPIGNRGILYLLEKGQEKW
jgi:hypothetical protein